MGPVHRLATATCQPLEGYLLTGASRKSPFGVVDEGHLLPVLERLQISAAPSPDLEKDQVGFDPEPSPKTLSSQTNIPETMPVGSGCKCQIFLPDWQESS